jgi:hypothetical protein
LRAREARRGHAHEQHAGNQPRYLEQIKHRLRKQGIRYELAARDTKSRATAMS